MKTQNQLTATSGKKGAKKRGYNRFEGHRANSTLGPISEHNIQYNELPPEGSYVIVNEMTFRHIALDTITRYEPSKAYFDAYGFPYVFQIVSYKKGRENALDKDNRVLLEQVPRNNRPVVVRPLLSTLLIATGSLYLELVDKDQFSTVEKYDPTNYVKIVDSKHRVEVSAS